MKKPHGRPPGAFLSVRHEEDDVPQKVALPDGPLVVGRGRHAELKLPDRTLSAVHCRFEPTTLGWKIVDLDSKNGTFVNEMLVKQRLLEDDDEIRIARTRMSFHEGAEDRALLKKVDRLVDDTNKRYGAAGVRRAGRRFATAAADRGVPGTLVGSEEIEATNRLQAVVSAMIEERRPQGIFDRIVDTLIEFTGAERGFFILAGPNMDHRQVVAARNFDHEGVRDALTKISRTVAAKTLETGDPVVVFDAGEDDQLKGTESVVGLRLRSILTVPVRGPQKPVGVLYLDNRFERGVFDESQLPLIRMFADQAAIALRNAELHEENANRLDELEQAKTEVEELNRILADRVAKTSAELQEVKEHVRREQDEAPIKYSYSNIIGKSRRMRELFLLLDKVTDSDVPVLIQGESGTGKELVARAIHHNGPRKNGPFVSENCAAIPETLLESELFGYKKGAFTGAHADKKGLFEVANGGTLFLDEIGDMAMSMQKKLLRVLQNGEIRPVGGERVITVTVRILAASNQDLRRLCKEGKFREDLLYRLNVITVELPPLRERREDIPLLVEKFMGEFVSSNKTQPRTISEDAIEALQAHDWPGNVRELRNEVHRAAALSDKVVVPLVLSSAVRRRIEEPEAIEGLGEKSLKEMVREVTVDLERRVIQQALRQSEGRKAAAARLLGVSRPTLDAKLEAYDIKVKR